MLPHAGGEYVYSGGPTGTGRVSLWMDAVRRRRIRSIADPRRWLCDVSLRDRPDGHRLEPGDLQRARPHDALAVRPDAGRGDSGDCGLCHRQLPDRRGRRPGADGPRRSSRSVASASSAWNRLLLVVRRLVASGRLPERGHTGGVAAFGLAMLAALWAYDGWNNMPMAAGEVKDPGRNVPRALIGGMVAIMAIYCSANLAYLYALPWPEDPDLELDGASRRTPGRHEGGADRVRRERRQADVDRVRAVGARRSNGATLTGPACHFHGARRDVHRPGCRPQPADARPGRGSPDPGGVGLRARRLGHRQSVNRLRDLRVVDLLWTGHVGGVRPESPGAELARPYRTLGYPLVPFVFVLVAVWLVINTLINRPVESVAGLVLISLGLPVYWYYRGSVGSKDPTWKGIGRV